jgi:sugar fermentation stimulation protein A
VSARAAKHLHELIEEVRAGRRATVLFILQRTDGRSLRPSQLHDPAFAAAAREAGEAGVRFRAARIRPTPEGFHFQRMIPVDLSPYDEATLQPYRDDLAAWSGWRRRGKARS